MQKRIASLAIAVLFIIALSGCSLATEQTAKRRLEKLLTVDFSLVSKAETDEKNTYTYVDENGVEFHYISEMDTFNIDGADFFSHENGYTDYPTAAVEHNKTRLIELCNTSGLNYTYSNDSFDTFTINVQSKTDAEIAAHLVEDLIAAQGAIHMKSSVDMFSSPNIRIFYADSYYTSVAFPFEEDIQLKYDDIYDEVIYDYADAVRCGAVSCDLTQKELESIPAKNLHMCVNGIPLKDISFFHSREDSRYIMELYDLVPSNGHYMGLESFSELCDEIGIRFIVEEDSCRWSIAGHEYRTEYVAGDNQDDKGYTVLYQDGKKLSEIEVYYAQSDSYLCRITPDDMAQMLSATYNIDNASGIINYTLTEHRLNNLDT